MVVSVVAGLAVRFAGDFQLQLARAEHRLHGAQAQAYLLGAESLAVLVLEEDVKGEAAEDAVDHLQETWAQIIEPFPVEGGWLLAGLEDAQSRLNLNALGAKAGAVDLPSVQRFNAQQKRFIRLLQSVDEYPLAESQAIAVMEALIDWLDSDDELTGFGGAERYFYESDGYAPANQAFSTVSELRLLRNITPELYEALLPHVTVLPAVTSMNVNTMTITLLRAINEDHLLSPLSLSEAEAMAAARGQYGYQGLTDFIAAGPFATRDGISNQGLSVNSEYFWVRAESQIVHQRRKMTRLLRRHEGKVSALTIR
jgi:general secretion pathway protein K